MIQSPWRDPFQVAMAKRKNRQRAKRRRFIALLSLGTVGAVLVATLSLLLLNHKSTLVNHIPLQQGQISTIVGLTHIAEIGSTSVIVDGHGSTLAVDANPYGVALVPTASATAPQSTLHSGDILVTNIGANDAGTTLVRFPGGKGPGQLFNTTPSADIKGPADQAFNTLSGTDWVANVGTNKILIFKPNGTILSMITSPLFHKPWGQAFNGGTHNRLDGAISSFFTSNVADATIDRIDVIPGPRGTTTTRVFQIGQLSSAGAETKIGLLWLPSLQFNGVHFTDVLLALDPAQNRIAAFPNSTTLNTTDIPATNAGLTVFQGKPLNMPGGFCLNPLNGDILVVNLNDNNLVEVNLTQGRTVGVRQIDNAPVDPQSGNGSALFGVAATTNQQGNLVVYFTDDNTNTLDVLS